MKKLARRQQQQQEQHNSQRLSQGEDLSVCVRGCVCVCVCVCRLAASIGVHLHDLIMPIRVVMTVITER